MRKRQDNSGGVPEWLVTFGDMMSLLLTFFIMLFSMSEIKKDDKFHAMIESLRKTFGYETTTISLIPGAEKNQNSFVKDLANLARAKRVNLMQGGAPVDAPAGENPQIVSQQHEGDPSSMKAVLFSEDSALLTDKAKLKLDKIAETIAGIPQLIELRGHTSRKPLPKGSPFRDHWDLAFARCQAVQNYLETLGIDPKRTRIYVAAGNELQYTGTDPQMQGDNSRVEIRVLSEKYDAQSDLKSSSE